MAFIVKISLNSQYFPTKLLVIFSSNVQNLNHINGLIFSFYSSDNLNLEIVIVISLFGPSGIKYL